MALLVGVRLEIGGWKLRDWEIGRLKARRSGVARERERVHNLQFIIHNSPFLISGVAAALAILTKSPALLLLPAAALIFVWAMWWAYRAKREDSWRRHLVQGLMWFAGLIATLLLVFPALWSAPLSVWQLLSSSAGRHIDEALRPTFFLGQVAYDHGARFYPLALLWRLSPFVCAGLILWLFAWLRQHRDSRRHWPVAPAFILLAWAGLFLVAITPAAKKFDRYMLPAIPALILLAALGWVAWTRAGGWLGKRWQQGLLTAALLGQVLYWLLFWPYPLAAYNLLVGGPWTAMRVMPVGWGESISTAGRWLADSQPDAEDEAAVSGIAPSLAPFFSGQTLLIEAGGREQADYVIYTAASEQERQSSLAEETAGLRLLQTIRYGGLEQAWIYRQPDPQRPDKTLHELSEPVAYGGRVALHAIRADVAPEQFTVLARWQRLEPGGHLLLKLELRDEQDNVWSGLETALLNEVYFYPEHWAKNETPEVLYRLERPPAMPPGDYSLTVMMFDEDSGGQLAVLDSGGSFRGVAYRAVSIALSPEENPIPASHLTIPQVADVSWFDGALKLLGYSVAPEMAAAGTELTLDVFWQTAAPLPENVHLEWTMQQQIGNCQLAIGNCEVEQADENPQSWRYVTPLSRYDTRLWRVEETIHEKVRLPIPPELAAGQYVWRVAPLGESTAWEVGRLEVVAADRHFELPEDIDVPLAYEFGEGVHLRGMALGSDAVAPGESGQLVLYWQTDEQPQAIYTVFVHVIDEEGDIVAQADHWPGGLPSQTWAAGQVIVDEVLLPVDADVPPGKYRIAVGLYTAEDGVRLPVDGETADRVILPQMLNIVHKADE
jgi:hypothetical protein